jgi:UDP-N-acetylmuramate dehydrogenase
MMVLEVSVMDMQALVNALGDRLELDVPLKRFTAARLGGPADALVIADSVSELIEVVQLAWRYDYPYIILGGGSNVLVSDAGVRGLVIVNRARGLRFDLSGEHPVVWAESGANFGALARQAASRGLGGLAWAAGIPGTLGGAVVNNAGAHGSDMAGQLVLAEILHRTESGRELNSTHSKWPVNDMMYSYRSSRLKREPGSAVVLSAVLKLEHSSPQAEKARMEELGAFRRRTQPPGASMGSMFKNPPSDYAGRLIEAAGLKGKSVGDAQISNLHANFFINRGAASAADVYALIELAHQAVAEQFDINMELEIELVGEWN